MMAAINPQDMFYVCAVFGTVITLLAAVIWKMVCIVKKAQEERDEMDRAFGDIEEEPARANHVSDVGLDLTSPEIHALAPSGGVHENGNGRYAE